MTDMTETANPGYSREQAIDEIDETLAMHAIDELETAGYAKVAGISPNMGVRLLSEPVLVSVEDMVRKLERTDGRPRKYDGDRYAFGPDYVDDDDGHRRVFTTGLAIWERRDQA